MRMLICGLTMSLGLVAASDLQAEVKVTVDGAEYTLSELMANCQSMTGAPEAQVACFTALSTLLADQDGEAEQDDGTVTAALDAFREVAQFQNDESGLSIIGTDCSIQMVYYNNYYHLSRRNVSSIDVFSAQFDASKLQFDRTDDIRGAEAPLVEGLMDDGVTAVWSGGVGLESGQDGFEPKSARTSIEAYANEVASQLSAQEDQTFEFVLVHPARHDASRDIWAAFETFVTACRTGNPSAETS